MMADFVVEKQGCSYFVAVKGVLVSGPHALLVAQDKRDEMERMAAWKERECMCCKAVFTSEGAHHRMCKTCRQKTDTSAWMV